MNNFIRKIFFIPLPIILTLELISGELYSQAFTEQWMKATSVWKWAFPKDHGSHPDFRTEWWYFTGNLIDNLKNRYGYQLTFFRQGIIPKPKDRRNPWAIRDIYFAHFALTDASLDRFWFSQRISRKGPGLAEAAKERMDIWLLNWMAKMEENNIMLRARTKDMQLSLILTPRKPVVLHGDRGISKKGPQENQASYYYSYTDLKTEGEIKTPASDKTIKVKGVSWFDHEFGSNQLSQDQIGWDWFSLHLSDGHDLMIYLLRRKDGSIEPNSSGTLVKRSGEAVHLKLSEIKIDILNYWKSKLSGAKYPSQWRIKIPSNRIEVEIIPLIPSQELFTEDSKGITYWEGAVLGSGKSFGQPVSCEGYVELTGYAGSLGGIF